MSSSRQGGKRLKPVIPHNGTGSVAHLNRTSDDRPDYLTPTELFRSPAPVSTRRVDGMPNNGDSGNGAMHGATFNGNKDLGEILEAIFKAEARALAEIPKTLATALLEEATAALINARRIYCFAFGSARLLASEAEYQFVRLGLHCIFIRDWMQLAIQAALLSSEDVVLAFSHTGRDRQTVQGLTLAQGTKATVIGVTSEADSPLARQSDIALVLAERDMQPRDCAPASKIPELALVHALATCVALRTSKQTAGPTRCDELIEKMLIR